jgi:hypothetical protein
MAKAYTIRNQKLRYCFIGSPHSDAMNSGTDVNQTSRTKSTRLVLDVHILHSTEINNEKGMMNHDLVV